MLTHGCIPYIRVNTVHSDFCWLFFRGRVHSNENGTLPFLLDIYSEVAYARMKTALSHFCWIAIPSAHSNGSAPIFAGLFYRGRLHSKEGGSLWM